MTKQSMVVVYPTYTEVLSQYKVLRTYIAFGLVTKFKGPFKKLTKPFLNGLGGKIKKGEKSLAAARREVREECGISPLVKDMRWIGTMDVLGPNNKHVVLFVYIWDTKKRITLTPKDGEFHSFHWQTIGGTYEACLDTFPEPVNILPCDRHWLPIFLLSETPSCGFVRRTETFRTNYKGGRPFAKIGTFKRKSPVR